jgi:histone arginine demethylase JMJD6
MTFQIERIDAIDVREFGRKYSAANIPVIIRGCVDHWPARGKWDLDYFAAKFSSKELMFSGRTWTMGGFIEQLLAHNGAGPAPYLNQVKLDEQFPELYADIADLKYTRDNLLSSWLLPGGMRITRGIKALFIGAEGSGFGKLHWDFSYLHVYISQLKGDKDFLVFAPGDTPYLYQNPDSPTDSLIEDINYCDAADYPDLQKATPIRFTVHEGETVFVPAGWWHSTKMRGLSISVAESALDRYNWKRRYEGYLESYRAANVPALKRLATRTYVQVMGTLLR